MEEMEGVSKIKASNKVIDFNRIKDKLIAIIAIVIGILAIVVATVTSQNYETRSVLGTISSLRIPVPINTSDILSGANRVSASQRAYMMTGDEKYKQERLNVWKEQIRPAADKLQALKVYMDDELHQRIVDETVDQLDYYEKLQDEIDLFYETEIKPQKLEVNGTDSASLYALSEKVLLLNRLDAELDSMVAGDASRARKKLRNVLKPLNQAQVKLLIDDNSKVISSIQSTIILLTIVFIIGVAVIIVLSVLLLKSMNKSIQRPTALLNAMAGGVLPEEDSHSKDELNQIFEATNVLSSNMKKASQFAVEIGEGHFDHEFQPAGKKDILGNSLIQMRDRLLEIAEQDKKTTWSAEGLSQVGNILRNETETEEELFNEILSYTVKYVGANQAALFIVDDQDEKVLDMVAAYAYGRKKYIKRQFKPGEGLVGQTYLEKQTIFISEVPDDFVKITSGLGGARPRSIIVCPLIVNQECYGIFEMASFHVLEKYKIDFIEELCDQVASALSKVRVNTKTQTLLAETQQQAEEMKAQEEELRQNMEEMTATQEEMNRVQSRIEQTLEQAPDAVVSIDETKSITFFNKAAERIFGYTKNEILGDNVKVIVPQEHQSEHDHYIDQNVRTGEDKVV